MATSRTPRKRTGIIGYLGNIADDTEEYVDDLLDRGRDIDRDVRSTTRRAWHDDDADTAEDIGALKDELDELTRKVEELSGARPVHGRPQKAP